MFIGREEELQLLNDLYQSEKFEFMVLYGRRRVGKTSLLQEFSKGKNAIFFSAQEKNDALNLIDFSNAVQKHFDGKSYGCFDNWETAAEYISGRMGEERLLVIIDEFPFIASENPSIKSILQHTIDHVWKQKNLFLILCGSSVSFMEKEVMGYKSPLYGRSTAQLEVVPFDYYDSARFFPAYSNVERLLMYGILGGIPCYLENMEDTKSIQKNIEEHILRTGVFLKEEPQTLLRMELREPAVYNSIFEAIANGASRLNEISGKIHEESQKCAKYLATLQGIKLIEKISPAGEEESSRKTIYKIRDHYFQFWYHFIFRDRSYLEMVGPAAAAEEIMQPENLSDFMGAAFEQICTQYMIRLAKKRKLPFIPHTIGRWWGNNQKLQRQDDIDILLLNRKKDSAIFCECKFRNVLFGKSEFEDLIAASEIFGQVKERHYYLFSKSGFTDWVVSEAAQRGNVTLVSVDDLFVD